MKTLLSLLLLVMLFGGSTAYKLTTHSHQCEMKQYLDKCVSKLEDGYTFLKNYELDGHNGEKKVIEYSYIFSKNTKYMIVIANGTADTRGVYVTLKDSQKRQITSSYINDKFYPIVSYTCSATGVYYLTYTFENPKNYCAASVLAFKR